jgi:mercuric ion transport protein
LNKADTGFAAAGTAGGLGALTAAASCCVLPLALAGTGVSASTLAPMVPLRLPLSLLALAAILAGWFLLYRRTRACTLDPTCARPARSTFVMLTIASVFVLLSLAWPLFEASLVSALQ